MSDDRDIDLEPYDRDTHEHDMTYENEQSMVKIPLREYDKLKDLSDMGNIHFDPDFAPEDK